MYIPAFVIISDNMLETLVDYPQLIEIPSRQKSKTMALPVGGVARFWTGSNEQVVGKWTVDITISLIVNPFSPITLSPRSGPMTNDKYPRALVLQSFQLVNAAQTRVAWLGAYRRGSGPFPAKPQYYP